VASRFTETLPGRARCLIGHPVNPPHLVPLVETLRRAVDVARRDRAGAKHLPRDRAGSGHHSTAEINGFVLNRLQGALLRRSLCGLVGEGFISAEDLDHTVKDGLGLRWSFLGPFENHRAQTRPAASPIIARAIPASTGNWPHPPPAPKSIKARTWTE